MKKRSVALSILSLLSLAVSFFLYILAPSLFYQSASGASTALNYLLYILFIGFFLTLAGFLLNQIGERAKGKYIYVFVFFLLLALALGGDFGWLAAQLASYGRLVSFLSSSAIGVSLWGVLLLLDLSSAIIALIFAIKSPKEGKAPALASLPAEEKKPLASEEAPLPPAVGAPLPVTEVNDDLAPITVNRPAPSAVNAPVAKATLPPVTGGESTFDAHLIQLIGHNILIVLWVVCTFSIAFPWAYASHQRWLAKHTVIEGNRLVFDGGGGQLIGNWIKWVFFTIITFGIYSLWVPLKLKNWQVKHLHFRSE